MQGVQAPEKNWVLVPRAMRKHFILFLRLEERVKGSGHGKWGPGQRQWAGGVDRFRARAAVGLKGVTDGQGVGG